MLYFHENTVCRPHFTGSRNICCGLYTVIYGRPMEHRTLPSWHSKFLPNDKCFFLWYNSKFILKYWVDFESLWMLCSIPTYISTCFDEKFHWCEVSDSLPWFTSNDTRKNYCTIKIWHHDVCCLAIFNTFAIWHPIVIENIPISMWWTLKH